MGYIAIKGLIFSDVAATNHIFILSILLISLQNCKLWVLINYVSTETEN